MLLQEASGTSTSPSGTPAKRAGISKSFFPFPGCVCNVLKGHSNLRPPRHAASSFALHSRGTDTRHRVGHSSTHAAHSFSPSIFSASGGHRPRDCPGRTRYGTARNLPVRKPPPLPGPKRPPRAKVTDAAAHRAGPRLSGPTGSPPRRRDRPRSPPPPAATRAGV